MSTARSAYVLRALRALVPHRPLGYLEAARIAERQATHLLELAGIQEPPISTAVIADLLGVAVRFEPGLPSAGLATATGTGWVIVLSADDTAARVRYSLLHEVKHIVDDAMIAWLYRPIDGMTADTVAERICDAFAAACLMPRVWIKRDWATGMRDTRTLATRYQVSPSAITIRLAALGLTSTRIPHSHHTHRRIAS